MRCRMLLEQRGPPRFGGGALRVVILQIDQQRGKGMLDVPAPLPSIPSQVLRLWQA